MSTKTFHTYLKNYIFLRNEKLQKPNRKIIQEHPIVKNSNIYFVTKIKKIRFDLNNITISSNGNLKGYLYIGNKKIKFKYSLIDVYYTIPDIKNHFHDETTFLKYFYNCELPSDFLNMLCMKYKFHKDIKINKKLSDEDGKTLYINSKLTYKLTKESDEHVLHGENIFGRLEELNKLPKNLDFLGELIYIGKSYDVISRTSEHEKFSQFQNLLRDDEELLFYFLEFEDSEFSIEDFPTLNNFKFISNLEINEIEKNDKVLLIEAFLINHFKPKINVLEKSIDLIKSPKVQKYLKKNGFDKMHVEINTEGILSKFGNSNIKHNNIHNIQLSF